MSEQMLEFPNTMQGMKEELTALRTENERLETLVKYLAMQIYKAPEINFANYDVDDIRKQDDALIGLWEMLPNDVQEEAKAAALSELEEKE